MDRPVTLVVDEKATGSGAALAALHRDQAATQGQYDPQADAWRVDLPAGDHVIELRDSAAGQVVARPLDGGTVTFVRFDPDKGTLAWKAKAATTTASDPWPQPGETESLDLDPGVHDWIEPTLAKVAKDL
ncbi:MAG: hypothetical protein R3B06_30930 [Kofleriaceae bacterium]